MHADRQTARHYEADRHIVGILCCENAKNEAPVDLIHVLNIAILSCGSEQ
jgi:hypothetical protein